MKQIVISVPNDKFGFFRELIKNLEFVTEIQRFYFKSTAIFLCHLCSKCWQKQ